MARFDRREFLASAALAAAGAGIGFRRNGKPLSIGTSEPEPNIVTPKRDMPKDLWEKLAAKGVREVSVEAPETVDISSAESHLTAQMVIGKPTLAVRANYGSWESLFDAFGI